MDICIKSVCLFREIFCWKMGVMCHSHHLYSKMRLTGKALDSDSGCKVWHLNVERLDSGRLKTWNLDAWMLGFWTLKLRTLECLDSRRLNSWINGRLDAWTLWFWTFGHLVVAFLTFPLEVLFMQFFCRLFHVSVKVYVQKNYLFSRKSHSKEVAVLKKYLKKCPKKVLITKM